MRFVVGFLLCTIFFYCANVGANPIYSTKKSKAGLTWFSQSDLGVASTLNQNYGKRKDDPVIAQWRPQQVSPLVLSKKGRRKKAALEWQLWNSDGSVSSMSFGKGNFGVLAGFDLDRNGAADIATVNGKRIAVRLNPFLESETADYDFNFESNVSSNGFPLVFNRDGEEDRIGFVSVESLNGIPKYFLSLRDLDGSLLRHDLAGFASREISEAYGIARPSGEDALLVVTKEGRSLEVTVLLLSGTIVYRERFRGKHSFAIGDFAVEEGEEFIVQKKRVARVINPFSNSMTRLRIDQGQIVDSVLAKGSGTVGTNTDSSDGGSKGSGKCDKFLPAPDGLNNFLAKNSDHGGIVYLTPDGSYSDGKILHHKTLKVLQDTRYTGVANGGRGHFRIPGSLPFGQHIFSAVKAGKRHCWRIPDGQSRVD